jgi:hypothetical protein
VVSQIFSALLLNALAYYPLIKLLRVMKRQGFLQEAPGVCAKACAQLRDRFAQRFPALFKAKVYAT